MEEELVKWQQEINLLKLRKPSMTIGNIINDPEKVCYNEYYGFLQYNQFLIGLQFKNIIHQYFDNIKVIVVVGFFLYRCLLYTSFSADIFFTFWRTSWRDWARSIIMVVGLWLTSVSVISC